MQERKFEIKFIVFKKSRIWICLIKGWLGAGRTFNKYSNVILSETKRSMGRFYFTFFILFSHVE